MVVVRAHRPAPLVLGLVGEVVEVADRCRLRMEGAGAAGAVGEDRLLRAVEGQVCLCLGAKGVEVVDRRWEISAGEEGEAARTLGMPCPSVAEVEEQDLELVGQEGRMGGHGCQ